MGLAASQCRLLFITSRQNDVSFKMQKISNDRIRLANDEDDIYAKYNQMCNAKVYEMADGEDLSYSNLMGAGAAATGKPTIVTNSSGKMVLDSNFYAALKIKGDKTSGTGSDFGVDVKTFIQTMTDIDMSKYSGELPVSMAEFLNDASKYKVKTKDGSSEVSFNEAYGKEPSSDVKTTDVTYQNFTSLEEALNKVQNSQLKTGSSTNLDDTDAGAVKVVQDYIDAMKAQIKTLLGVDPSKGSSLNSQIDYAIQKTKDQYNTCIDAGDNKEAHKKQEAICHEHSGSSNSYDQRVVSWDLVNQHIYKSLQVINNQTGSTSESLTLKKETANTNKQGWTAEEWKNAYELAEEKYEDYLDMLGANDFTDVEKNQIAYYTQIFEKAAAGWAYDENANDAKYLMNKIGNGSYMLDGKDAVAKGTVVEKEDKAAQEEAKTWYEYEKKKIKRKEDKFDSEQQKLQTEYSALTNDIESVKSIINANVQKSFTYCQNG